MRVEPFTVHWPFAAGTRCGIGAPARGGPDRTTVNGIPDATPFVPWAGVMDSTSSSGRVVVVVVVALSLIHI